jgi:hypothetical protein
MTRALAQLRKSFTFLQTLTANGGIVELLVIIFAREDFRLEFPADAMVVLGRLGATVALEVKPHPTSPETAVVA